MLIKTNFKTITTVKERFSICFVMLFKAIHLFPMNTTWCHINTITVQNIVVINWTGQMRFEVNTGFSLALWGQCRNPHLPETYRLIKTVCYQNQNYEENKHVLPSTEADPNHSGGLSIPHRQARVCACLFCVCLCLVRGFHSQGRR